MEISWTNPRVKLLRKRKVALQELCVTRGIDFEPEETKQNLVDKLCPQSEARRQTNQLFEALGAGPVFPDP